MKISRNESNNDTLIENSLAEGWVWCRVGDLLHVNYGKGLKEEKRVKGPVPVYGSNGIVGQHNSALTEGPAIIIGRKGSIGAVHYSPRSCWPIDTTYFINNFSGLNPLYLAYVFRTLNLGELDTSTAIPGVNRDELYEQRIPLAPLAEQKRIVDRIEELLARVSKVRERLAKVQIILRRFRQVVLAAACSGRLTADWRENYEGTKVSKGNPGKIFTDRLADRESLPSVNKLAELPSDWFWATIERLASPERGSIQSGPFGSNLHHSEFQDTGILAIGIDNVLNGQFTSGKEHRISDRKYQELKKYAVCPLDVLVTVMATIGRCCVVPEDIETAILTKHVYRITVDRTLIEPDYFMFALQGDIVVKQQIQSQIRGQTRPGINGQILKRIAIPTPPLPEQHEIVRQVRILFKLADTIEKRVALATTQEGKLAQAVLAKAFRGELVPTEAELARREGRSFESVPVLLACIKAEANMGLSGKSARRKSGARTG